MNRIPKKFLSAAFIIFGIFLIFYYVRNFGVNVPIADDWNNVETSILWKCTNLTLRVYLPSTTSIA
jgi:hypothetical protein